MKKQGKLITLIELFYPSAVILPAIVALVCTLFMASPVSARPLRFAAIPLLNKADMIQQFAPFCDYIATITQRPVELVYYESYQTLLDALASNNLDLAYLGPLPYAALTSKNAGFEPVVRFINSDGSTSYTCALVTFGCYTPRPGAEKPTIALTQPYSTCGYLYTQKLLKTRSIDIEKSNYYYTGHHTTCCLDVINGKAQLAGVKTSIARQYAKLGLRIIARSEPIPGFLLVANRHTLSTHAIEQIRAQLLQLDSRHNHNDVNIIAGWGDMLRHGIIKAKDADYQGIRELFQHTHIPEVAQ